MSKMISSFHQGLTPELIKRAKEELGETDEIRVSGIKELKRLIKEEPDFNPCTDDAFLTRFLRARKYNVDRAFETLKNYYQYKAVNSGVLTDFKPSHFRRRHEEVAVGVFEHRDELECVIGYFRIGQVDLNKVSPQDIFSYTLLITEIALECEANQITGYCFVMDLSGLSLLRARRFASPTFLYKMVSAIQNVYPSRIKAFHIVNEPIYFDLIFRILKPFLSEKLSSRFYIHGSNLDSLHKHMKPDILPEELGGTQGPAKMMEQNVFKILEEKEDYFIKMQKFGYTGKTLQKMTKDNQNAVYN